MTTVAYYKPKKPNHRSHSALRGPPSGELRRFTDSDHILLLKRENEALKLKVIKLELRNEGLTKNFQAMLTELKAAHNKRLKELETMLLAQLAYAQQLEVRLSCSAVTPGHRLTQDSVPMTLESSYAKNLAQRTAPEAQELETSLETVKAQDHPSMNEEVISAFRKATSEEGKRQEFISKLSDKLSRYLAS
jgi:hypothetical protein